MQLGIKTVEDGKMWLIDDAYYPIGGGISSRLINDSLQYCETNIVSDIIIAIGRGLYFSRGFRGLS